MWTITGTRDKKSQNTKNRTTGSDYTQGRKLQSNTGNSKLNPIITRSNNRNSTKAETHKEGTKGMVNKSKFARSKSSWGRIMVGHQDR